MPVSSTSLPKLHQAVLDNNIPALKRLLEGKCCDVEQLAQWPQVKQEFLGTPMHFAAVYGNIPAEALLSAGASVNSKGTRNLSPLHWASMCGHDKMVMWLIEHGADVLQKNEIGNTALHWAAGIGNVAVGEILLSKGVDINCQCNSGWTPLHYAAHHGNNEMVSWLLDNAADAQIKSTNGRTALHLAARKGHVVVGEILMSKGVDINCQCNSGWTPLHYAAYYGNNEMVSWLLDNGADVLIKSTDGTTPLDVANEEGQTEAARLIQNNINNATTQREILLSQKVRSRTSSNASTVASGTSSQSTIDQPYDMKKINYQGVAVIINNQDFSASGGMLSNRDGSQHDTDKLCAELSVLGLDVHCFVDLTAGKMLNCLTYYSSLDHSQNTCFMCFILTHGSEGKIYGVDGKSVTPLQVTSKFVAATCPSLKGKPKAFVIVACKGKEEIKVDGSVSPDVDAIGACAAPLTPPPSPERESHQLPTDDEERLHEKDLVPLQEEDFLVAFSTIPDHVSYRNTEFGTLYVKWLTKNLSKYGGKRCMTDILRNTEKHLVDDVVPDDRSSTDKKQVCYKMDTLKRQFILSGKDMMPKYDESNESETPPGDQN